MTALYHLNENIAHLLEGFLESAVPLIAGLAEVIGLFIIVHLDFLKKQFYPLPFRVA